MREGRFHIAKGLAAFAVGAAMLLSAAPAGAAVQPYGTNDAGGFRNVLPPGENGIGTLSEYLNFKVSGNYPPHWVDQQPLYDGLLYAAPNLTEDQIPQYYKDATFGVKPGDVESTTSPIPGVTILRDSGYGVAHIYGDSRSDTMFGAGYASARDRLFLMDILRHTGRAQLSSFLGGSLTNRETDRTTWQNGPYTDAELQQQVEALPSEYGQEGAQALQDAKDYVAGINAYIAEVSADPSKLPAEYAASNQLPQPWSLGDVAACAAMVGAIFGKGGGKEIDSAQTMQAMVDRFGKKAGRKAWKGFRSKNDPQAPTTLTKAFPYETNDAFSSKGLALPNRNSVQPVNIGPKLPASRAGSGDGGDTWGDAISNALNEGGQMSNWELVSAAHTNTGHPLGVLGPQVGYYVPQILLELDLHGPGIDSRGAAFPGISFLTLLGHGRDYAWSATTSTADNVDTFAEVLCKDKFHYMYKGKCLAMEKLQRTNSWVPGQFDSTPAGSETLTVYRTVHGMVYARGKVGKKKVAFVTARSTYFHEPDSVVGFERLNDPSYTTSPQQFQQAASAINFLFNWSYLDSQHIAYYMSGTLPQRAKGTSPDFPVFGTGKFDWQGYNPTTHTEKVLGFAKHPQAIDPDYLVSWNNKQAPKFAAADDKYSYGATFRSKMISDRVKAAIANGQKINLAQLVQSMELPATQDIRSFADLPLLFKAVGNPGGALGQAVATLKAWQAGGGNLRDLNKDGVLDENAAAQLMDAWWPRLLTAEFKPALGKKAFDQLQVVLPFGKPVGPGTTPSRLSFSDGWWGYVQKDLQDIYGPKPKGAWARKYCGNGSKQKCRNALRKSLSQALKDTPQYLYGYGSCSSDPQASCWNLNRSTEATAFPAVRTAPAQNRPTFQQTVSILNSVPR
jgi:acyl-homoserine lactone acylase PvdQ